MTRRRTLSPAAIDARAAALRELTTNGLSAEDSECWCAAWEDEAERQHVQPDSPFFWDAGRGWIDANRSMPVLPTPARQAFGLPAFSVIRT